MNIRPLVQSFHRLRPVVQFGRASLSNQIKLLEPDANILKLVACPLSKQPLVYVPNKREMVSLAARVAFPIFPDGTLDLNPRSGRVITDDAEFDEIAKNGETIR